MGTDRITARVLLAVAPVLLACAGAGTSPAPAPASRPSEVPVLRVGTSGDYPPFSLAASVDAYAPAPHRGFDVAVAERLAADLGLALEWVPFRWPELEARLAAGDFDVAMSGVTWRPWRAAHGAMSRAVATGGPCVVGDPGPARGAGARIAVNRGGVLERFARARFPAAEILAVDRNLSLGARLARGEVDAVVTDSFEMSHLGVESRKRVCEPPVDRKVYWVAPARAEDLAPRLDAWLAANEVALDALRARWLGGSAPRRETDHLLDLLARRFAYAPAIAAWKRARGLPIGDPAREARVLDGARAQAVAAGLAPEPMAALFGLQIELGKRLQREASAPAADEPPLDLERDIRPELSRLGARIVASAARLLPLEAEALDRADWGPLRAWLSDGELAQLRAALQALAAAASAGAPGEPARARFVDALPRGPSVEQRLDEIRRLLQAALEYPPIARRRGLEGIAWVQFAIDRDGAPHDVSLARSSGHDVLDRAARRALERAGRLPWVYGRVEVPVRFSLEGPS